MHPSLIKSAVAALVLVAALADTNAQAQATIDHNKALAGNVTPGDAPGFPVTISLPGSYKLTGNLSVPTNTTGIEIAVDGVTVDLNGFRIVSTGVCTRNVLTFAVDCTATSGFGVTALPALSSVVVRNGGVRGFQTGVSIDAGVIEGLTLRHNVFGIFVGSEVTASRVTGVIADSNGYAVYLNAGLVERAVLTSNGAGVSGGKAERVSVMDSQMIDNGLGVERAGLRGNRVIGNKTDISQTVAF